MWPTVGFGDAEIGEQERRGLGSHGTTTVGMQGQLAGRRGMFGGGIIEQCREHGGAFSVGDAPADDSAAEDIDDDVEVEAHRGLHCRAVAASPSGSMSTSLLGAGLLRSHQRRRRRQSLPELSLIHISEPTRRTPISY